MHDLAFVGHRHPGRLRLRWTLRNETTDPKEPLDDLLPLHTILRARVVGFEAANDGGVTNGA